MTRPRARRMLNAGRLKGLQATGSIPLRAKLRRIQARTPVLAFGRRPAPPDYVGVGVQRAGTSWWHALIEAHPGVAPLSLGGKELHYFDEFWHGTFDEADARAYADLFIRRPGMLCGEWTPRYMYDPWTPPLLRRAAPQARLLVLLRDPVERFRSGLWHAATYTGRLDAHVVHDAVGRGHYGSQMRLLLQHFPREQVLVLQLERCRREPGAMLARTYRFLGLDPAFRPADDKLAMPRNKRSGPPVQIDRALVGSLPQRYAEEMRLLLELVGDDVDPALWPSVGSLPRG